MDYYENESKYTISDDRVNDPSSIEIEERSSDRIISQIQQTMYT